jgi:fatty-acyl-CoA synthase
LAAGDRVGAYGRNSDAYLLLWLACTRAGFVHVPINYALTERELRYIVEQSGARALIHDAKLEAAAAAVAGPRSGLVTGTFAGGAGLDVLGAATAATADAGAPPRPRTVMRRAVSAARGQPHHAGRFVATLASGRK